MDDMIRILAAFALAVSVAGCGGGEPPAQAEQAPYLPISTGASWTYRVTNGTTGAVTNKSSIVEALEDVGGSKAGVTAFRMRTEKDTGYTVSWQESSPTGVVRHREQGFDATGAMKVEEYYEASKLRFDETPGRTVPAASWTENYNEIVTDVPTATTTTVAKTEQWTIEAVGEAVTVPAGTFTCIRVRRVSAVIGQSAKTFWYARGVGKVKETGGQTEELLSYSIP